MTEVKSVLIYCPLCSQRGNIDIERDTFKKSQNGLVAINVSDHKICDHSFTFYLDRNFNVRDYLVSDFKLEVPDIQVFDDFEEYQIPDGLNLDIIKLNFHALTLVSIIRSVMLRKKILLILEDSLFRKQIKEFLNVIFEDAFDFDLSIEESYKDYKKNKKSYKKHIIIHKNELIRDKFKILHQKKLNVERVIIQKFLGEDSPHSSIIVIKNEIQKAFKLAEELAGQIRDKIGTDFNLKHLLEKIAEKYGVKLTLTYRVFLCEIIENYFGVEIPEVAKFFLCRL